MPLYSEPRASDSDFELTKEEKWLLKTFTESETIPLSDLKNEDIKALKAYGLIKRRYRHETDELGNEYDDDCYVITEKGLRIYLSKEKKSKEYHISLILSIVAVLISLISLLKP